MKSIFPRQTRRAVTAGKQKAWHENRVHRTCSITTGERFCLDVRTSTFALAAARLSARSFDSSGHSGVHGGEVKSVQSETGRIEEPRGWQEGKQSGKNWRERCKYLKNEMAERVAAGDGERNR